MRCSKCGAENREIARFCDRCGVQLQPQCPSCGAPTRVGAKFCDACGAALSESPSRPTAPAAASTTGFRVSSETALPEALDGERKTVTALFADIKGSTEIMEDVDPEEARALVDPALKLMIDAVRHYDGHVKSTGDGVFAMFGAPVAHEDHPQRALLAAVRMQEELRRYGARLQAEGRAPVEIRVGVNTGEVVVRSLATGATQVEYTPIGHTTNLASRLQSIARTGSIVASEATRKFCEGYFILKPLGATKVKGVSEPVAVYEVTGLGPLRTRLQRSAGRGYTKFVGREREMETLKRAAEQARAGHGQIVAAMAEAGVGKSRLFHEFKTISQSRWMTLETFSVSHGKASAFLSLIDLLQNYFKISPEDDERQRREKVAGKVVILDRALEDTLARLYGLLGIAEPDAPLAQMDAQIERRRTLESVKRLLLRESLNQPLVVIFEDLHWIDDETQALLNLLADSIGTSKVLLLVNYRPEYTHTWGGKTYYTQLRLDPLGRESAQEMLEAMLGNALELASLKRLIITRSEGNPFFIEEMVQALFEERALVRNGTVKLAKSLSEVKVPATVEAILAARIDRLPPEEKDLLLTLAVIGNEFPLDLVKQADEAIERMLSNLQLGEFIYEQPAVGEVEYIFKHALTQEVSYNSLLAERRKELHRRAAEAIEDLYANRLDDKCEELAHHYGRAGDNPKAVQYLRLAGRQAFERSAYKEANAHVARGLELLATLPEGRARDQEEIRLRLVLGRVLGAIKGQTEEETGAALRRAQELCRLTGDTSELREVLSALSTFHRLKGELQRARQFIEEALATSQPASISQHAWELLGFGQNLYFTGELTRSREVIEQAIALHESQPKSSGLGMRAHANTQVLASRVCWLLGFPDLALRRSREAVALAQRSHDPSALAFALGFSSEVHFHCGQHEILRQRVDALIAHLSEHELQALIYLGRAKALQGWMLTRQGAHDEGVRLVREGLALTRAAGGRTSLPLSLDVLARAYAEAGRIEDGLETLGEALHLQQEIGERSYQAELNRLTGELLLISDPKAPQAAEAYFRKAIDIAKGQSAKSWELRAAISLARLLARTGRRDEARAMLAEIYNWFTEGFDTADLKDAKALLDDLSH